MAAGHPGQAVMGAWPPRDLRERVRRRAGHGAAAARARGTCRPTYLVGGAVRDLLRGAVPSTRHRRGGRRRARWRGRWPSAWEATRASTSASARRPCETPSSPSKLRGHPQRDLRRARRAAARGPGRAGSTTSGGATSRSTRWRWRSPATISATSTTPTAAWPTWRLGSCASSTRARFLDDPTRLLRAVRYEVRLGFQMDEPTPSAPPARPSPSDALSTVSGARCATS